jgi:electron transport complex protein RnfB
LPDVTEIPDLLARRAAEQKRIRMMLDSLRAEEEAMIKGGEDAVAWVKQELCIGCDQCTIVCDDDAIELYDTPLASPIMQVEVNRKARILRDECTGCKLCVLGCPTDAIIMIDR